MGAWEERARYTDPAADTSRTTTIWVARCNPTWNVKKCPP
jgi:hypothetical protein